MKVKKIFLIFVSLTLLPKCSSVPLPSSVWKVDEIKNRNVIIFVPGLFGSKIVDAETGSTAFQTLGQGLWGGSLALNGEILGIAGSKSLKPESLLESVTIIPGIYSADVYGESIRYLQENFGNNATIVPFYFDWREDDVKGVQSLGRVIKELKKAGASRIALVGHSLGGILISFYLRYGEQPLTGITETWEGTKLVDVAIIAGTPFRGTIAAYRDLLHGTKVGLASAPLSALSLGSFPSYYQFLPPEEKYPKLYKAENWPKWKMGLFSNADNCSMEVLSARKQYTEKYLKNGLVFNNLMVAKVKNKIKSKFPFLVITGTGHTTLSSVKDNQNWFKSDEGDGLVTTESSRVPEAFQECLKTKSISLPLEHVGMYTKESVQSEVTGYLKANGF